MTNKTISYYQLDDTITLAYSQQAGKTPGVVFFPGFMSDMSGTKAQALADYCQSQQRAFLRFDYRGHGLSTGKITDSTIGLWLQDAMTLITKLTQGPQILVGSSMGGWLALLTTLHCPEKVVGLVGIAAAPDFTEDLLWQHLSASDQQKLIKDKILYQPCPYSEQPYAFTLQLVEEARQHLLLRDSINLKQPVRLLHGLADKEVPWQTSVRIAEKLISTNVRVNLVKQGDHRLSRNTDLQLLCSTVEELQKEVSI